MAAPVIKQAISRARLEPGEIDDVIMGAALQQGMQGFNVARQCVIAAGLPVSIAGQSVDRQCSSGLMSISMSAACGCVGLHTVADDFPTDIAICACIFEIRQRMRPIQVARYKRYVRKF
jgi:hypothetical protein